MFRIILVFFLVRISFIPLLIKLSEMGNRPWLRLLTKPTPITPILSQVFVTALITLLTYPVSTYTAERSFSGMKRLQTPLRRTKTNERLSAFAILHNIELLIASYLHPKTGNRLRSFFLRAIMALDHRRLIRPGKNSGFKFTLQNLANKSGCV